LFIFGQPDKSGLGLFDIHPVDVAGSWSNDFGDFHLTYGPASTYPIIAAFFFSLLQANWTYTGYDASAHVAEETIGARVSSAWGVFLSVAVSAVAGYVFLMALTLHTPDLSTLFPQTLATPLQDGASQYYFGSGVAVISILVYNMGEFLGDLVSAGIAIAMAFCGLSSVAAAGRMLYAFARDDGMPMSGWLKKVSHRYRTPANSLTAIVVVSWLFSVAAFFVGGGTAIVIVTAVSTIFLYAAYGVCIYLGATTSDWLNHRVWSLGRWSKLIAWIAVLWCVVLMGLFSFPTSGNISWPFMVITVLLLLVYYFGWARKRFKGPRSMGAEQQLTDIEKEFNQAAGELSQA
jgi:amino acid transporter